MVYGVPLAPVRSAIDSARALWSAQAGLRFGSAQDVSLYFPTVLRPPVQHPESKAASSRRTPERRRVNALRGRTLPVHDRPAGRTGGQGNRAWPPPGHGVGHEIIVSAKSSHRTIT